MKTIDDAGKAVSDAEAALARFDGATAAVKARTAELSQLQAEHESNTADTSGDFGKRLKIHAANSSALTLHQADIATLQAAAGVQKRQALAAGRAASAKLTSLHAQLGAVARAQAKETAYENFEPRQIAPLMPTLILASKVVRALPAVVDQPRDEEEALQSFRRLRSVFDTLKNYAQANGGWEKSSEPSSGQSAADAPVSAMAEPVSV